MPAPSSFVVETISVETPTVIAFRGEVNYHSVPEFESILNHELDQGHRSLMIDVAELTSINGSGIQAIVTTAARCNLMGGELTVCSPKLELQRLLNAAGIATLEQIAPNRAMKARLGSEQIGESIGVEDTSQNLEPDDRRMMSFPADHDVVDGALRMVVALAKATVGGANGVSVSLRRHGTLSTVASSDQTILSMDAVQYATGEGPCVDASVQGRWFHAESLESEQRWPDFTPRARALGINAILSSPLLTQEVPVGALNIYSRSESAFGPKDQKLASVFANEISIVLTNAGADFTDEQLQSRYIQALWSREIIAQAQGVLMERHGIDGIEAFTTICQDSARSGEPLRKRAENIVRSIQMSNLKLGDDSKRDL